MRIRVARSTALCFVVRSAHSLAPKQTHLPPARTMVGFHQDEHGDWVARLECGHFQHVRHNPPMTERPWVLTEQGRTSFLGHTLFCKKCLEGAPKDEKG